jgi:hypothetical protein
MRSIAFALAVVFAGCTAEQSPAPRGPEPGCGPVPEMCATTFECAVVEEADGTTTCGGAGCCQSFCDVNACDRCCTPIDLPETNDATAN